MLARRDLLRRSGMGLGALALSDLLGRTEMAEGASNPLAPRPPHHPPRAKRMVHIFANGGPSHLDTFDPKPLLARYAGQPLPGETPRTERKTGAVLPSPFTYRHHGQSGTEVSELFSHVAEHVDDMCVVRSMRTDVPNHEPSLLLMNCGDPRQSRPSVGSWITYGLGTENQNLPGFVVLCPGGFPQAGPANWQSGFLPGIHQGTHIDTAAADVDKLIENLSSPKRPRDLQRRQLDLVAALDERHLASRRENRDLEARIQSFELAYRMQMEATDVFDISREPKSVRQRYGDGVQGRQLLIARRLLERGVRFVQVWTGANQPWDTHEANDSKHRQLAGACDRPIAAFLEDLKRQGLLTDTLVLWGGEFGRTPTVEMPAPGASHTGGSPGRDHNSYGFSVWMAGGGVKAGHVHGATDDFGFKAVDRPVHVHDLHATMLHLLGFDHQRLTFRYAGRDFRLTDVHGTVVDEILA